MVLTITKCWGEVKEGMIIYLYSESQAKDNYILKLEKSPLDMSNGWLPIEQMFEYTVDDCWYKDS